MAEKYGLSASYFGPTACNAALVEELLHYEGSEKAKQTLEKRINELRSIASSLETRIQALIGSKRMELLNVTDEALKQPKALERISGNVDAVELHLKGAAACLAEKRAVLGCVSRRRRLHGLHRALAQTTSISFHAEEFERLLAQSDFLGAATILTALVSSEAAVHALTQRLLLSARAIPRRIVVFWTSKDKAGARGGFSSSIQCLQKLHGLRLIRGTVSEEIVSQLRESMLEQCQAIADLDESIPDQSRPLGAVRQAEVACDILFSAIEISRQLALVEDGKTHVLTSEFAAAAGSLAETSLEIVSKSLREYTGNASRGKDAAPSLASTTYLLPLCILTATATVLDRFTSHFSVPFPAASLEDAVRRWRAVATEAFRKQCLEGLLACIIREDWTRAPRRSVPLYSLKPERWTQIDLSTYLRKTLASTSGAFARLCGAKASPLINPFAPASSWLARVGSMSSVAEELSDDGEDVPNERVLTRSTAFATDILLHSGTVVDWFPFMAGTLVLAAYDTFDLVLAWMLLCLGPQQDIQAVFLDPDPAHPPPDCVGGPALFECHRHLLLQQRYFDLRKAILTIRGRRAARPVPSRDQPWTSRYPLPISWDRRPGNSIQGYRAALQRLTGAQSILDFHGFIVALIKTLGSQPISTVVLGLDSKDSKRSTMSAIIDYLLHDDTKLAVNQLRNLLIENAAGEVVSLALIWKAPLVKLINESTFPPDNETVNVITQSAVCHIKDGLIRLDGISGGSIATSTLAALKAAIWRLIIHECTNVLALAKPLRSDVAVKGTVNDRMIPHELLEPLKVIIFEKICAGARAVLSDLDQSVNAEFFLKFYNAHFLNSEEAAKFYRDNIGEGFSVQELTGLLSHTTPDRSILRLLVADLHAWTCELLRYLAGLSGEDKTTKQPS